MVYQYCPTGFAAFPSLRRNPMLKTMKNKLTLVLICLNAAVRLHAQTGLPDPTFLTGSGPDNYVTAMAQQADGKILIGGLFTFYNGTFRSGIARLSSDGTLDPSFSAGTGFNQSWIRAIAEQADGGVLVAGDFGFFQGNIQRGLVRLDATGAFDPTFDSGNELGNGGKGYALVVQPDGKIIVGGDFTSYNGTPRNYLVRINPDGSIDNTFTYAGGTNGRVWAIALQPDGRILLGGDFTTYNVQPVGRMIRLEADGTIDPTFDPGAGFAGPQPWTIGIVFTIALQPDGKILVGGAFNTFDGVAQNRLIRLEADGSKDLTFDVGTGCSDDVSDIALAGDGKLFVAGDFYGYNGNDVLQGLALVNANGVGEVFGDVTQQFMGGVVHALLVQPNGKVIVGGEYAYFDDFGAVHSFLMRMDTDISTRLPDQREESTLIFPNPAQDRLRFNGLQPGSSTLRVLASDGRIVLQERIAADGSLAVGALHSGAYTVQVRSANGRTGYFRFIKE